MGASWDGIQLRGANGGRDLQHVLTQEAFALTIKRFIISHHFNR